MKRFVWILVAACGGGSSNTPPVSPAAPPIDTAKPDPVGKPMPPPQVDAKPDVPAGAAAARDAELAQKAAGYIDAFTNFEPVFTRDGKRVIFASNRDGLPQLYVSDVGKPEAAATHLLTTKERVTGAFPTKDGKSVIFQMDTGADELWSFYKVDLDGKNLVELSPGEKLNRDQLFVPDNAPTVGYFSARKMSESKSTIYALTLATPGAAKPVYAHDQPLFLYDVDRDGKRALINEYPSRSENYLDVLDLAAGKPERLYPKTGKVSIFAGHFSPDGKTAYVATDAGEEQALILALDTKTGKELARHVIAPATAQLGNLSVAQRGNTIAISLIVGTHSEIRMLDGTKLTPKATVKMPLGQGFGFGFSDDGKRLAAQWSTPGAPTDVFSIDAASGAVTTLRKEARPTLAGMPKIAASVSEIKAFDGGTIPTNVYVADGEQGVPHPVIVVYHGGPGGVSMIRWNASTGYFVSLGYTVVEPNVRGSSGFGRAFEEGDNGPKRLDAFKDIETSARWVAQQPWADKTKLVVYGSSYGGYTTLVALSRWPELWRAGVDLVGIVNLKTFMATTSGVIRQIFLVEFGDPDKDAAFLASISPSTDFDKIVDPTFVYAGANDPRVPRSESDLITKALRQRKVPSEYMVADNEGHSLGRRENQLAFFARCARFLETHLK